MQTLKIYGPPGTGKTYTLLNLFEKELAATKPDKICFVTFTRTARLEALERTKLTENDLPYLKTIHAICYKLLGIRHNQLIQPKHIRAFGQKLGVKLSGYMPDPLSLESLTEGVMMPTKADRLLQLNHLGRHRGIHLKEALRYAPPELDFAYAKWFTEAYRNWKASEQLLDYTDLLTRYLDDGPVLPADVLFVDEAQDLSWLQWRVVHKLQSGVRRRYLAGDDDQAIFIWAGASADMFNTEPADEVQILPQSFRLARAIHEVSQRIITRVRVRQAKEFRPRDEEGVYKPVAYLEHKLIDGTVLCLFRNHHRGVKLALQLEELGIPFKGSHGVLGQQPVREALRGWLKLSNQEQLTREEAQCLIDFVPQGLLQPGIKTRLAGTQPIMLTPTAILNREGFDVPWNRALVKLPKLGYLERVVNKYGLEAALNPKVSLQSIHQSKGREADTVILDMEMARRTYDAYMDNPEDEHRCWYVAVTRARTNLFTLWPSDPMAYII